MPTHAIVMVFTNQAGYPKNERVGLTITPITVKPIE